jgi:hypothetical protein
MVAPVAWFARGGQNDDLPSPPEFSNVVIVEPTGTPGQDVWQQIDDALALLKGAPGTVVLPRGALRISKPVALHSGVRLVGAGTSLEAPPGHPNPIPWTHLAFVPDAKDTPGREYAIHVVGDPADPITDCEVRNLLVVGMTGTISDPSDGGILVEHALGTVIEGVVVRGFYRSTELHAASVNAARPFKELRSGGRVGFGIHLGPGAKDSVISNCHFAEVTCGVAYTGGATGNTTRECSSGGIISTNAYFEASSGNVFMDNVLDGAITFAQFEALDADRNLVISNRLEGQTFMSGPGQSSNYFKTPRRYHFAFFGSSEGNVVFSNQSIKKAASYVTVSGATDNAAFYFGLQGASSRPSTLSPAEIRAGSGLVESGTASGSYRFPIPEDWDWSSDLILEVMFKEGSSPKVINGPVSLDLDVWAWGGNDPYESPRGATSSPVTLSSGSPNEFYSTSIAIPAAWLDLLNFDSPQDRVLTDYVDLQLTRSQDGQGGSLAVMSVLVRYRAIHGSTLVQRCRNQ